MIGTVDRGIGALLRLTAAGHAEDLGLCRRRCRGGGGRYDVGLVMAMPPDPPAEITPPIPRSRSIHREKASAIAATEAPRSLLKTAAEPFGCIAATWLGVTSARDGLPEVERSTVRVGTP